MLKKVSPLFNIILPLLLGIVLLYWNKSRVRKAEDIGLGEGTSSYYPSLNNYPIHLSTPSSLDLFMKGWKKRGGSELYLWVGNSQLHGVNQYKNSDKNSVEILFDSLKQYNREVLGTSYPNANLQELLATTVYYTSIVKIKAVIMPVFYDDMREDGIRDIISSCNPLVMALKKDSIYFDNIESIKSLETKSNEMPNTEESKDFGGIKETAQDVSERYLNGKLESQWEIWKKRPDFRGDFFNDLYVWRNKLLGIKPTTVRKIIPGRFRQNYNAFETLSKFCLIKKLPLYIYIPPIRSDVPPPYNMNEYTAFKEQVKADCKKWGVHFINLENLVPAKYWGTTGTKNDVNGGGQIDFMHFQFGGHRLLADTVFKTLIRTE